MDINFIKTFAHDNRFGVTHPFTHEEVKMLARKWLPEFRFHEDDEFHPISIRQYLYRHNVLNRSELWLTGHEHSSPMTPFLYSPWVLYESADGYFVVPDFNSKSITSKSILTNLKDLEYDIALEFFGSNQSVGNMKIPKFPIITLAEYRSLLETVEFNLLAHISSDYPRDEENILDAIQGPALFGNNREDWVNLLKLIDLHKQGKWVDVGRLLEGVLSDVISETEWEIIRDFSFLEYYLLYAYNDLNEYESFGNKHEADIEGCCVAFQGRWAVEALESEKGKEKYPGEEGRKRFILEKFKPYCIMSLAHASDQGLDEIKYVRDQSPEEIRSDLRVWVALGSHASYLSGVNEHDLTGIEEEDLVGGAIAICLLNPLLCIPAIILAIILEHSLPEDKTSDNGVHSVPSSEDTGQPPQSGSNVIASYVETTPLSVDKNSYQEPSIYNGDSTATLTERAYPGKWGGHNGWFNQSPSFNNKTKRYIEKLRKFLDDVVPEERDPGGIY